MARNRQISDLVDEWEPRIRRAFLRSIQDIADSAQIGVIEAKLKAGDVDGALEAVGLDPAKFRGLDKAIAEAFEDGGDFTARGLPALKQSGEPTLKVLFDVRNPRAERWLKEESGTLIRDIVDDQRVMVRQHLTAGMAEGQNPRDVALDLAGRMGANGKRSGGVIGLTSSQETWVRNFRAKLSDPKRLTEALDNRLRDKRFDRTIAKAAKEGRALPPEQIEAMVRNYRGRALKLRAEGIARTEAIRSLNQAQDEAARQAIEGGQMDANLVTKVWIATKDARTRDTHKALDGQEVGINQMFRSPSGAMLAYPGDANAPASETINCRCFYRLRVDYFRGLS